jgi:hypothetical protein
MSVADRNLQDENLELKDKIKLLEKKVDEFMKLFTTLERVCDSDDDTEYNSNDDSDNDDSEMGSCDEESTDEEIQPKCDNLEVKINN